MDREAQPLSRAQIREIQDRLRQAVGKLGGWRKTESRAGIGKSTISAWLRPPRADATWRGPTLASLRALSVASGWSIDFLCGFPVREERRGGELAVPSISVDELSAALHAHARKEIVARRVFSTTVQAVLIDPSTLLDSIVDEYAGRAHQLQRQLAREGSRRLVSRLKQRLYSTTDPEAKEMARLSLEAALYHAGSSYDGTPQVPDGEPGLMESLGWKPDYEEGSAPARDADPKRP